MHLLKRLSLSLSRIIPHSYSSLSSLSPCLDSSKLGNARYSKAWPSAWSRAVPLNSKKHNGYFDFLGQRGLASCVHLALPLLTVRGLHRKQQAAFDSDGKDEKPTNGSSVVSFLF